MTVNVSIVFCYAPIWDEMTKRCDDLGSGFVEGNSFGIDHRFNFLSSGADKEISVHFWIKARQFTYTMLLL